MSTGGSGGLRYRWGRVAAPLLLLVPFLAVTAASAPDVAEAGPLAAATADARIAFAGTRHRSLGTVTSDTTSAPFFGAGATHMDVQPAALGDQLVFASRRDEKYPQIYLRTADSAVHRLTSGLDAANPRLTPDGRSVLFDAPGPDGKQRDIWRVGTDGAGLTRLTDTPANEVHPTVSPEGGRIAYVSDADAAAGRQVYVRAMGGGTATLVSDPAQGPASEPVWNPVDDAENRDVIAYTATGPEGPRLKWTDGVNRGQLLSGAQAQWRTHGAAWLPDGDGVLFLSPDRTCNCEGDWQHVFRVDAHSDAVPTVVLSENREISEVTWLGPREGGSTVVERITGATPNEVTLQDVRMDGTDPRDLHLKILNEDPAADTNTDPAKDPLFQPAAGFDPWTERQNYTPDGRRIVLTRFEGEPNQRIMRIWMADADGTNEAALPLAGRGPRDWDTDPTFSPDGKTLAFTRISPGGTNGTAGPSRILIADVATGAIKGEVVPPAGQPVGGDAQPTWSSDGTTLAFTRNLVINGNGANKHVWTVPVDRLGEQRDLSSKICPGACDVIDDSPAFSPDGTTIALNRKGGGGRIDERNALLVTSLDGSGCRVLVPDDAPDDAAVCQRDMMENPGPFQPRDAAWLPDGKGLVVSVRMSRAVNTPEKLKRVDLANGATSDLTVHLPGRHKEPTLQQSVDLAVEAPATVPQFTVGTPGTVRVDVVNRGPAASPGTRLTVAPPAGLTVTGISAPGATCDPATLTCVLGVVPPGARVPVDVTLTGLVPGDQPVDWTVTGAVLDPNPTDNTGRTVVPVREAPEPTPSPSTPTPTPTTPSPSPTIQPPTSPPPPPPAPLAGPGLRVTAQPNPGYVGGRVVVTYTVRNGRDALATGLRLRIGLPKGVPHDGPPPGCDASFDCALPDLRPGGRAVVQVILRPDRALTGQVTGRLTTTGTDADPRDNTARQRIRILQPRIVAVPPIGKPGFVTSVRGKDFPPGAPVRFTWQPGITAAAAPTVPRANGTFIGQLLILAKDQTGPRTITASGPGFSPVKTDFLVVTGTIQPPDVVTRR
ncbi:hypothetical protein [Streptomyces sp. NPDC090025]|uniref:hypothetical protein n=1 Tax=Streptomyces sp. NPDC090025 TaxID=3365922 RepID=UPI0038348680